MTAAPGTAELCEMFLALAERKNGNAVMERDKVYYHIRRQDDIVDKG